MKIKDMALFENTNVRRMVDDFGDSIAITKLDNRSSIAIGFKRSDGEVVTMILDHTHTAAFVSTIRDVILNG